MEIPDGLDDFRGSKHVRLANSLSRGHLKIVLRSQILIIIFRSFWAGRAFSSPDPVRARVRARVRDYWSPPRSAIVKYSLLLSAGVFPPIQTRLGIIKLYCQSMDGVTGFFDFGAFCYNSVYLKVTYSVTRFFSVGFVFALNSFAWSH